MISDVRLTTKERTVFYHVSKQNYTTAVKLATNLGFSYPACVRFLNSLTEKGFMVKSKIRHEDGYRYHVPIKTNNRGEPLQIPFKNGFYSLEDLLLYFRQEIPKGKNDFEKYGLLISSAIYHLAYRAVQLRDGQDPNSPSPIQVHHFLKNAIKQYQDFITLLKTLADLPIFGDNQEVLDTFGKINEEYLKYAEDELFLPFWEQGIISPMGLKDKFPETLRLLKVQFEKSYGESVNVNG